MNESRGGGDGEGGRRGEEQEEQEQEQEQGRLGLTFECKDGVEGQTAAVGVWDGVFFRCIKGLGLEKWLGLGFGFGV